MIRSWGRVLRSYVSEKMTRVRKAITGLEPKGCSPDPYPEPVDSSPLHPRSLILGRAILLLRNCYVGEGGDVQNQLYDLKRKLLILGTCKPNVSTAEEIMNDVRLDLKGFTLLDKRAVSEYIKEYVSVLLKVEKSDCYFQFLIHLVMGDYIKLSTSPKVLLQILRVQNVFPDLDRSILECAVEDYIRLCEKYRLSSSASSEDPIICGTFSFRNSKDLLVRILEDDRANEMASVYVDGLRRSLFTTSIRD